MKKALVALAVAMVSALAAVGQDQVLEPVLVNPATLEIVKPNATRLALANSLARVDATYTNAVAKALSALQPNAVAVTNVIVSADSKTNTIIVVGGQITSWVVTE